ncbi:MAG: TM0106 family RecB-like putative nuclease [Actinomycetota bacterium]|nr:TM0106 family RecB-like putative nuclease [Actinomycetota bacterium]
MGLTAMDKEPVLIGGGELGRCPTRIHHSRFNDAARSTNAVIEHRIAQGHRWEEIVVARILRGYPAWAMVSTAADPFDRAAPVVINRDTTALDREEITTLLLWAGVPLIFGARISASRFRSVGVPDLLVRLDDGYAPIDIKHHKVIGKRGLPARSTGVDRLDDTGGVQRPFRSERVTDLLQVAHYWTLLDSVGLANSRRLVGIIGSEPQFTCLWVDLEDGAPRLIDRYQAALEEAIAVVEAGRDHPEAPMVPPIWRGECRSCPWAEFCLSELEDLDHVSLLPAIGANDTRQLLASGITTTARMADLDPGVFVGDLRIPDEAVLQARARGAGALIRRAGTDLTLPVAAVEIDFDIETYGGVLYLAGLLITDHDGSAFEPIADWTGTPNGERRVLADLFTFFDNVAASGSAVVYHWTGYERTILNAAAERHALSLSTAPSVDSWFDRYACDLWAWTKQRFVSPNGYSLKVIAPLCGFEWRDDDPGGAQSELWYADVLRGNGNQRRRLLEYNEDDVAAQLAIRRWVRGHA